MAQTNSNYPGSPRMSVPVETQPPTLILVTTRVVPVLPSSGREKILRFVVDALYQSFDVRVIRIDSILEGFSFGRAFTILALGARELLAGNPLPIQSLAFYSADHLRRILIEIGGRDDCSVYLDGVRTIAYARHLKRRVEPLRLVCDLDDLISRRTEELLKGGLPIRAGYLATFMPTIISALILNGPLRKLLLRYERSLVRRAEVELCRICQSVVLISEQETKMLHARIPADLRPNVVTIAPAFSPNPARAFLPEVHRFIFVGSDTLLQNQLSIDYLLDVWETHRPARTLHIFGHSRRKYRVLDGVIIEGFTSFEDIYTEGSVALCPAFLKGGIKTKVLEALEYCVLPIGNATSFEGIEELDELSLGHSEFVEFVLNPQNHLEQALAAATDLQKQLMFRQPAPIISAKWVSLFASSTRTAHRDA